MTRRITTVTIASMVEDALGAVPGPGNVRSRPRGAEATGGPPPKDSVLGAVLSLVHATIDGMVAVTPKNLQSATSVDRGTRPVRVHLRGVNSQGFPAELDLVADLDGSLRINAAARLVIRNAAGQVVANPTQTFTAAPSDSVKTLTGKFREWITQAEALQMAPIGSNNAPVFLGSRAMGSTSPFGPTTMR